VTPEPYFERHINIFTGMRMGPQLLPKHHDINILEEMMLVMCVADNGHVLVALFESAFDVSITEFV